MCRWNVPLLTLGLAIVILPADNASAQLRAHRHLVPQPEIGDGAVRGLDASRIFHEESPPVVTDRYAFASTRLAQEQATPEPVQPFDVAPPTTAAPQPIQPFEGAPGPTALGAEALLDPFGGPRFGTQQVLGETGRQAPPAPGTEIVGPGAVAAQATTAPGQLLTETTAVTTVTARRRNPVEQEPSIRGYQSNDIYSQADGALFLPVRQDLDTLLSKIEPSLIETIDVVPGPYGLRYGPGFAFLNVVQVSTPRYEDGPEVHNRFGVTYRPNGDQLYGRDTVYGGSYDWGFFLNYGNRLGSDYEAGNDLDIPSSYHNQDFLGQLGWDIGDDSRLEVRYHRLDQTDTEYAVQFFDVNFLGSDAFTVNFVNDDLADTGAEYRAGAWWNRSRFYGDTELAGKQRVDFPVIRRVDAALEALDPAIDDFVGFTDGDLTSTGARSVITFGDEDWALLRLGSDIRYIEQHTAERFQLFRPTAPLPDDRIETIFTNQPRSHAVDPGLFAEATVPMTEFWFVRLGGRMDWYHTEARGFEATRDGARPDGNLAGLTGGDSDRLEADDELYAGYLVNELVLTEELTNRIGFGYAERAPTLTERYADGIFLGIIQSGFSRVIGDPNLDKTGALQVDWGLEAEYSNFQGRIDLFHAWMYDYITYSANIINDPAGARLLRATNTDLATLVGGGMYAEYDLAMWLSVFGSLYYVEGRDQDIDVPLTGISPMQSRMGFRLQDSGGGEVWGLEFSARWVAEQDRLGALRQLDPNGVLSGIALVESRTPSFTLFAVRGYYNVNEGLNLVGGVENLFDATYLEHRDLRLPANGVFPETLALAPGFSPYLGLEWIY